MHVLVHTAEPAIGTGAGVGAPGALGGGGKRVKGVGSGPSCSGVTNTVRRQFPCRSLLQSVLTSSCMGDRRFVAVRRCQSLGFPRFLVSRCAVEAELKAGNLVPLFIEGLSITRNFYALRQDDLELPAAEALWNFLVARQDSATNQIR